MAVVALVPVAGSVAVGITQCSWRSVLGFQTYRIAVGPESVVASCSSEAVDSRWLSNIGVGLVVRPSQASCRSAGSSTSSSLPPPLTTSTLLVSRRRRGSGSCA